MQPPDGCSSYNSLPLRDLSFTPPRHSHNTATRLHCKSNWARGRPPDVPAGCTTHMHVDDQLYTWPGHVDMDVADRLPPAWWPVFVHCFVTTIHIELEGPFLLLIGCLDLAVGRVLRSTHLTSSARRMEVSKSPGTSRLVAHSMHCLVKHVKFTQPRVGLDAGLAKSLRTGRWANLRPRSSAWHSRAAAGRMYVDRLANKSPPHPQL